jgi:hypothetical protein
LNDRHVRDVQNGLGFVAVFVGIAEVAVDLIVGALGTKLIIGKTMLRRDRLVTLNLIKMKSFRL